jgi:hypothetical protein
LLQIVKEYRYEDGVEVEPEQLYSKLIWRTNIEEMKKTLAKVVPVNLNFLEKKQISANLLDN